MQGGHLAENREIKSIINIKLSSRSMNFVYHGLYNYILKQNSLNNYLFLYSHNGMKLKNDFRMPLEIKASMKFQTSNISKYF